MEKVFQKPDEIVECEDKECGGEVTEQYDEIDGEHYPDGTRCIKCGKWQ